MSYVRSLLRIDLAAALYHKGPQQWGPRRTLAPSGQPVGRRDIRKASENPQMFTPSRGSHKEEGFPDEPRVLPDRHSNLHEICQTRLENRFER